MTDELLEINQMLIEVTEISCAHAVENDVCYKSSVTETTFNAPILSNGYPKNSFSFGNNFQKILGTHGKPRENIVRAIVLRVIECVTVPQFYYRGSLEFKSFHKTANDTRTSGRKGHQCIFTIP